MIEQTFSSAGEFARHVLAMPGADDQRRCIAEHWPLVDDEAAEILKQAVEDAIHANLQQALQIADLLDCAAQRSGNELHRALAWLAKGNIYNIGLADYPKALDFYAAALEVYAKWGNARGEARVKLGRLWALSCLGRYSEAFADGEVCLQILREQQDWKLLTITMMNLSQVHVYNGSDELALHWLEQAATTLRSFAPDHKELLGWIEQNRAISLRNMGRFEESIQASRSAWTGLKTLGQLIEAARAQQNLAMTYYLLGRYNEALTNLDEAYTVFADDQRWANAMMAELFMTDCLLQMRRFDDVLEICQRIRQQFQDLSVEQVVAEAMVNEAAAYTQRGEHTTALGVLNEALAIFQKLDQPLWIAITQLDIATLYQRTGHFGQSITLACAAAAVFAARHFPCKEADAWLAAANAALAGAEHTQTRQWIETALRIGTEKAIPIVIFQSQRLLGLLLERTGDEAAALRCYDQAITELEKLCGSLMLEYRANFLDDKSTVYEEAVHLALTLGEVQRGLAYAERAKSRALVDLLTRRLDLKIQARRREDQPLVDELHRLCQQRDQLQNRVMNAEASLLRDHVLDAIHPHYVGLAAVEKKITTLRHKLLTHNADYARDAALWQFRSESYQDYLPNDTVLLEYYVTKGQVMVFCVHADAVTVYPLACAWQEVQTLLQKWQLNIQAVMRNPFQRAAQLLDNARGILQHLYRRLIAPLRAQLDTKRLIIVPHGSLHYAPFHAFYDGTAYLLEQYEVSYLPAASLLRFVQAPAETGDEYLIYGNTLGQTLPHIAHEIDAVAKTLGGTPLMDEAITKPCLIDAMQRAQIIHLATHGQFHPDNPLFSGLHIHDGWLTSLDIFNMQLRASLVTLSGCNTGRHHILGGDEVAGLMRAFLSAGAKSLVLSLWPIEDSASAWLMAQFYQQIQQGTAKGAALRSAQLQFIQQSLPAQFDPIPTNHPFFWAPFFLVGALA